jgi:ribosomal protein S19E (S16A)
MHGERRNASRLLFGRLKERETGRRDHRYEYTIKTGLKEMEPEDVDWIYLAQNRDKCGFLQIPQ